MDKTPPPNHPTPTEKNRLAISELKTSQDFCGSLANKAGNDEQSRKTSVADVRDWQEGDVYIGRRCPIWFLPASLRGVFPDGIKQSDWRNTPLPDHATPEERAASIAAYKARLLKRPELLARLPELKGKRLVCWCAPNACHGDVLAEMANALPDTDPTIRAGSLADDPSPLVKLADVPETDPTPIPPHSYDEATIRAGSLRQLDAEISGWQGERIDALMANDLPKANRLRQKIDAQAGVRALLEKPRVDRKAKVVETQAEKEWEATLEREHLAAVNAGEVAAAVPNTELVQHSEPPHPPTSPSVSLFKTMADCSPTLVSIEEILWMIANPSKQTRKLVEEIRAIEMKIKGIREDGEADEYWYECEGSMMVVELEEKKKGVKVKLPYVTFGGVFEGGRRYEHLKTYSRILICDFDHLSEHGIGVEDFRSRINQLPTTLFSFLSPSGDGFKVGVKLDAGDGEKITHERFFHLANAYHQEKVGMALDTNGKDVNRLCFLSYDPTPFHNPHSTALSLPAIEEAAEQLPLLPLPPRAHSTTLSPISGPEKEWNVEEVEGMLAHITIPEHDHAKWVNVCYAVSSIDHLPLSERVGLLERWSGRVGGDAERYGRAAGGYHHHITTQPSRSVTIGTLIQLARDGGWRFPSPPPKVRRTYIDNDTGRADRWIDAHHEDVRWIVEMKAWMVWGGNVWQEDGEKKVREMAKDDARKMMEESFSHPGTAERKVVMERARKMGDSSAINSMLELANSDPKVVLRKKHLNANPYLLGVKNGVLDLRTHSLRSGGRADLITKTAGVEFDPHAVCPRWESFLDEVMGGDEKLVDYLQRLVGYGLTGEVTEHLFPFLYGGGKNGKSTFIETLFWLMGDYALKAQAELTMEDKRGGNAESIIAQLHGIRCVVGSEVDAGGKLAEGRLKNITGGDQMTGRALYGAPFSFAPSHLLWGFGNHKPIISGTDLGVWRRLKLIPFLVTIPPEKRDGRLGEKLRAEGSGILNWALRGLRRWEEIGMEKDEPTAVKEAVKAYRTAEDELGGFIDAALEKAGGFEMSGAEVYRIYKLWAEEEGIRLLEKQGKLLNKLWDRGMRVETRKSGVRFLVGWRENGR